jgi:zinc transporter
VQADEGVERQGMSEARPLFAFVVRGGRWQAVSTFADVDATAASADFIWVHLNLSDTAGQTWLHCRPWPLDVIQMVAAPVQRGKLFFTRELIYGHLRDFRVGSAAALQAGSLSVVASDKSLITGRRIPLRSIEELRRRVEAHTVAPTTPFSLVTEFFRALNDIGEGLLQEASDRLRVLEAKVLKRESAGLSADILEVRRSSIEIARDMTYKRTAMLGLAHEHPAALPADEFERLNRQIHRYAALVEDAQEYAERCQFLLEELRAQVDEETNRNLYILTTFSAIFLPATLIASIWGMNVVGTPFSNSPSGFWAVTGLIAASFASVLIILFRFGFFWRVRSHHAHARTRWQTSNRL